eukprot:Tamp_04284.p1 GENE.Tamp_04284~~Tamp_04284.p1  ORF type:complete len:774 (-),score=163.43 Tamp_04284:477-2798(-)
MSKSRDEGQVVEMGGPESNQERYHRYKKCLGKGAFKTVYEAFDSEQGNLVAWNQVDRGNLDGESYNDFQSDVLKLKHLNHKSIIKLLDWWVSEDGGVVFITELMTSGDLKKYVRTKQININLRTLRKWARQILEALDYLHTAFDHPIVHRDIKCDNIFINGNLGEVKLGDLGLSTMMTQTHAASVLGTPEFMAPEMYGETYNEKVDIYAFGMCILEIYTGQYPYQECQNPGQIFRKVHEGVPPQALVKIENVAVKHFIEWCLLPEANRPSAKELLDHPLLVDLAEAPPEGRTASVAKEASAANTPPGGTPTLRSMDMAGAASDKAHLANSAPPMPEAAGGGGTAASAGGTAASADGVRRAADPPPAVATVQTAAGEASGKLKSSSPAPQEESKPMADKPIVITDIVVQPPDTAAQGEEGAAQIVINAQIDGKQKKIQFEFNLQEDDAGDVAGDLVDELVECHAKALPSESQEKRDQRVYDMKQEFQECIVEAVSQLAATCAQQNSEEPSPAAEMSVRNPDQSDAPAAAAAPAAVPISAAVPTSAAVPPSAADALLMPSVHTAVKTGVSVAPATSAPLPPAMDGVAGASVGVASVGVAQEAVGTEDSARAKAWSGDGTQVHADGAQPAAMTGLAVPAPYGNAVAGAVGAGADVHSADGASSGNPLTNTCNSHAEAGSGLEQVQGKTAGTAVPPVAHPNQLGHHSPSQMNPPQSQATAERAADGNHDARMEEMKRRKSELRDRYEVRRKALEDEYQRDLKLLEQEYSDLPQEPPS